MTSNYQKGLNFSVFSTFFLVILIGFYVFISLASSSLNRRFSQVEESIASYTKCEEISHIIRDTTNELAEQAQLFIMTHDTKYAAGYLNEKFVNQKRENAMNELLSTVSSPSDSNYVKLQTAMQQSESLASMELYGMKLAYMAAGLSDIPSEISKINIKQSDIRKNSEEQQEVAESTIFSEGYLLYKNRVNGNCVGIVNDIKHNIQRDLINESQNTQKLLRLFSILQVIALVLSAIYFVIIVTHIIIPLRLFTTSLRKKETMPITGASELRFLASTYNEVHKFDVLTGSLSRRAFVELCNRFKEEKINLGLILVDVDSFKSINDNNGHSRGDLVLTTVANCLKCKFNENAYVTRIGGDEFAVLLPNIDIAEGNNIVAKMEALNQMLESEIKDIPVSVSAGIALSRNGYSQKLFENADKALYTVKERGKKGASLHQEQI